MKNKRPSFQNSPSEFVSDLRSWVYKSQQEAAQASRVDRSTVSKWESIDEKTPVPPFGYVALLVVHFVKKRGDSEEDKGFYLEQVKRAIQWHYHEDGYVQIKTWAELSKEAEDFIEKQKSKQTSRQKAKAGSATQGAEFDFARIQELLTGVTALPTDYDTRINNFLEEYLGTTDSPVPFGGRQEVMAQLDQWLDDPEAPPYLLMAAPAGRGKSALLARWSHGLLTRNKLTIVFIPISIRFGTNLDKVVFPILATRLASLHNEEIRTTIQQSEEIWQGIAADYLRRPLPDGRQLLVILDGLDEAINSRAFGPSLFSLDPPPGLRLVVSARYTTYAPDTPRWLQYLDWRRPSLAKAMDLLPLDMAGVIEVLGVPLEQLGQWQDIVQQLYRLSEGDPLLVSLYVKDLWGRKEEVPHLQPKDLQGIVPGLDGYFGMWWEQQKNLWGKETRLREPGVRIMLQLLACAQGPLTRDDIADHLVVPNDKLDSLLIEESLKSLARLVIGDGKQQGYVFSHSRLGQYFYEEKLSPGERKQWQSRFLTWGRKTLAELNEDTLSPDNVSGYLLEHYRAHLEHADSVLKMNIPPDDYLTMVSDGWRRAWEAFEAGHAGFLNDVDTAQKRADNENQWAIEAGHRPPYLGITLKCALFRASVSSLADQMSAGLIEAMIAKQIWQPNTALAYARQLSKPEQQAHALARLASYLPENHKENTLVEAAAIAQSIQNEISQAEAVAMIAPYLDEPHLRKALAIARKMMLPGFQAANLIYRLAELGYCEEAITTAQNIFIFLDRAYTLAGLIPKLAQLGYSPEILLEIITPEYFSMGEVFFYSLYYYVYIKLIPFLSEPLRSKVWKEILSATEKSLNQFSDFAEKNKNNGLSIFGILPDIFRETHILLQQIKNVATKNSSLFETKSDWFELQLRQLLEISRHIPGGPCDLTSFPLAVLENDLQQKDEYYIKWAYPVIEIIADLPVSLLPDALNIAREIEDEHYKPTALKVLAVRMAELGQLQEALEVLQEVRNDISRWGTWSERTHAFAALLPHFPEAMLPEVMNLAQQFEIDSDQLVYFAPYLPEPILRQLLSVPYQIKDPKTRYNIVGEMASRLAELGHSEEALQLLEQVEDEVVWAKTVVKIISGLPKLTQNEILQKILDNSQLEPEDRAVTLSKLFPQFSKEAQQNTFTEILSILPQIEIKTRVSVLATLAPHVSDKKSLNEALRETLDVLPQIENKERASLLARLAPHLTEPLLRETLASTVEVWGPTYTLVKLNQRLAELGYVNEALNGVRQIIIAWHNRSYSRYIRSKKFFGYYTDESFISSQSDARSELTNWLPRLDELNFYFGDFLSQITIPLGDLITVSSLMGVVPYLPETQQERLVNAAYQTADQIQDDGFKACALAEICPYLPETEKRETLQRILSIFQQVEVGTEKLSSVAIVANLAGQLAKFGYSQEALDKVEQIENIGDKGQALTGLLPHLQEPDKSKIVNRTFSIAQQVTNPVIRRAILNKLSPHLSQTLLRKALVMTQQIGDEDKQKDILARLEDVLAQLNSSETDPSQKNDDWPNHLVKSYPLQDKEIGRQIEDLWSTEIDPEEKRFILAGWIPDLSEKWKDKALGRAISRIYNERSGKYTYTDSVDDYDSMLVAMASFLAKQGLITEAYEAIDNINAENYKHRALQWIKVHSSELDCALVTVFEMQDFDQPKALTALRSRLASMPSDTFYSNWQKALAVCSTRSRPDLLTIIPTLAPVVIGLGGKESLVEIIQVIQDFVHRWP